MGEQYQHSWATFVLQMLAEEPRSGYNLLGLQDPQSVCGLDSKSNKVREWTKCVDYTLRFQMQHILPKVNLTRKKPQKTRIFLQESMLFPV